jgi:hypothetical protein
MYVTLMDLKDRNIRIPRRRPGPDRLSHAGVRRWATLSPAAGSRFPMIAQTDSTYSPTDPTTWARAPNYVIGLDIGMHADPSAYVLAGVWSAPSHVIGVVDCKTFPLVTPFEDVADEVVRIAGENQARVIVDASNNAAFVGMLAAHLPQPAVNWLAAAAITGAAAHAAQPTTTPVAIGGLRSAVPRWTLSKSELIETIAAEGGNKTLLIAPVGDWEVLQAEFAAMERIVRASGAAAYSAPSGKHDDLVMALSLAVFGCRRFERPALRRHLVKARVGAAGWT